METSHSLSFFFCAVASILPTSPNLKSQTHLSLSVVVTHCRSHQTIDRVGPDGVAEFRLNKEQWLEFRPHDLYNIRGNQRNYRNLGGRS